MYIYTLMYIINNMKRGKYEHTIEFQISCIRIMCPILLCALYLSLMCILINTSTPPIFQQMAPIRNQVNTMRNMLEDYYNGTQLLEDTWFFDTNNTQALAHKFAQSIQHKKSFIIGAIGSSVTAGHDNCNYD